MPAKSLQSCPTLWDPLDSSLPGSCVHGILQARILKWVAMPYSRGSSQPRDLTQSLPSPILAGRFFTTSTTWQAQTNAIPSPKSTANDFSFQQHIRVLELKSSKISLESVRPLWAAYTLLCTPVFWKGGSAVKNLPANKVK